MGFSSTRVRRTKLIAGASIAAFVTAACGGAGNNNAGANNTAGTKGQTITLYNGQHEQTTNALVSAFEKQTGIHVKVRSDGEGVLAQQIQQEGAKSPADVFYTENTPPLVRLDEAKLLSPIDQSTLASVPAKYSAANGDWAGVSVRVGELAYNTNTLTPDQLPKSILDLADPKWKGQLDIAPSETDLQPIVTSIAADKGDAAAVAWLKAIKDNAGNHVDPDNEALIANINKGETALGVINHYYWYRFNSESGASKMHSALGAFAPHDDGYLLDVSGAAVTKSSKHQAAAQQLVAFLTNAAGQKVLADGDSYEYPIAPGVEPNAALPPLVADNAKPFNLEQIGDGNHAVTLLQQAGLE